MTSDKPTTPDPKASDKAPVKTKSVVKTAPKKAAQAQTSPASKAKLAASETSKSVTPPAQPVKPKPAAAKSATAKTEAQKPPAAEPLPKNLAQPKASKPAAQKAPAAKTTEASAVSPKASKPAVSAQPKRQIATPEIPKVDNAEAAAALTSLPDISSKAELLPKLEVAPALITAPQKPVPKARKRKPLPPAIQGIRKRLPHFIQLMRVDKPIGILLLLWPTLWALWLAAKGIPSVKNLVIFCLGVVVMRSAGCVINDFADRKIDGKVARTQGRPLAAGVISSREAIIVFVFLCLVAFGLVLLTDPLTIKLSVGGLLLAFSYPFMKRHTHLPQVVLGAAFAWGIPMAYAAQTGVLDKNMWLIYFAVVIWTVVYDTFYAMVDRDDDLKIGVKSTAILFGEQDRVITGALQILTLYALYLVGQAFSLGWVFYLSLGVVAGLFGYQQWLIRFRERTACFKAFLNNNWVGAVVFVGIALDLALK